MKIGFEIVDWRFISRFRHVRREQFVVMMLTLGFSMFVDLLIAVAIGLIAAAMASARQFERLELDSCDLRPAAGHDEFPRWLRTTPASSIHSLPGSALYRSGVPFTVASSKKLITTISLDIRDHEVVILDFSKTVYMDESAALVVERIGRHVPSKSRPSAS